jgi:hypothetical protein
MYSAKGELLGVLLMAHAHFGENGRTCICDTFEQNILNVWTIH